ncbi:hypothetical protein AB0C14_40250 [Microbispora hainanensis]|uniref:hypothetical protein n=1 Tax=Microbispora hainanensis TaxID=568844 RepID=UPI0033D4CD19
MASRIAGYAADNRAQIVPLLWLFTGPILFAVSLAGAVWLLRSRQAGPWRAIGIAGPVALVLVVATGGKAYYAIGTAASFMAAGSIVVDRWLVRGRAGIKWAIFTVAAGRLGLHRPEVVVDREVARAPNNQLTNRPAFRSETTPFAQPSQSTSARGVPVARLGAVGGLGVAGRLIGVPFEGGRSKGG